MLSKSEIISGIVADFPACEREILSPQGILSILVFPIIIKGEFFGFIGFDNCLEARMWNESEISLLQAAARAISLAYERFQAEVKLQQQLNRSYIFKEISEKIRAKLNTEKILKTAAIQIGEALGVSRTLIHYILLLQ
ncbi:MAG: GAF domain-containing protein [Calothrix sp. SM1_7_51]|nr:GAF domain-containing protein [Calothrix sp. SM1_7_51]